MRIFAGFLLLAALAKSDSGPQPPCGSGDVSPAYPDVDRPPVVRVWESGDLGRDWRPPSCIGWQDPGSSTLVVTVGRFHYPAGREGLLRRIGAISELRGLPYWSTTHQQWRTLIVDAFALSGEATGQRRADFLPQELTQGRPVLFEQEDSLSGKAIFEMRFRNLSADRLVFDIANVTTVSFLMLPIFRPGEVQSICFLERESTDVWRYYHLARTGGNVASLTAGHAASSINRAVAIYRHLAGIQTDKEPPAAR